MYKAWYKATEATTTRFTWTWLRAEILRARSYWWAWMAKNDYLSRMWPLSVTKDYASLERFEVLGDCGSVLPQYLRRACQAR